MLPEAESSAVTASLPAWAVAAAQTAAAQRDAGDVAAAIATLRAVLDRAPELAAVEASLALLCAQSGDHRGAILAYRRVLAAEPAHAQAAFNLASLLLERGALAEAIAAFEQAARLRPESAETFAALGTALFRQGRLDEAEAAYRRALALRPADHRTHSNLIYMMLHAPAAIHRAADEARAWGRRHAAPDPAGTAPHANDRDPERRLRVGYVSPDLRRHPVARLLEPILDGHDRGQVESFAYAEVAKPDEVTRRLESCADHWRWIAGRSDAEVAAQIRADGIDILVDQAGHTANNRLALLGRRPAPVQASWMGGGGTTGVAAIDYMIGDAQNMLPGCEAHCTETLVRLPQTWGGKRGLGHVPATDRPPVLDSGVITFASFNRLEKTHAGVLDAWARILHAVPGSRFLLKTFAMRDEGTRRWIAAAFAARGVDGSRLILEPASASDAYFARFGAVDIMLDTFPYSGGIISRDALDAGVPVVTLPNLFRTGAMTERRLKRLDLQDLAASTVDDYVAVAVALAGDRARLASLRRTIPERLLRFAPADGPRRVTALESAYRQMWRRWCAGLPPAPITIPD